MEATMTISETIRNEAVAAIAKLQALLRDVDSPSMERAIRKEIRKLRRLVG
jgi:hypothetical protein